MIGLSGLLASAHNQRQLVRAGAQLAKAREEHNAFARIMDSIPGSISVAISRDSGITVTCKTRVPKVGRSK